jgi:hypothetical protein
MKYQEVATKLHKLGCQEIPRRGGGTTGIPPYRAAKIHTCSIHLINL